MRQEGMCCIAQKSETLIDPGRQDGHVEQLPHLQALRVGLLKQCQNGRVEVLVHLQHLAQMALRVPVAARFRLGFWVDVDEVEQFVVRRRVHDDAPVGAVPDAQLACPLHKVAGFGVFLRNLPLHQEPEGTLP